MNYEYEHVSCNICGESDDELISQSGQFDLPVNVVLCKNCGLGYLNPRWKKAAYLDFYKKEYDKYYRPNFKKDRQGENPIIERLKNNGLLPGKINKILDIGSGAGHNLLDFKNIYPFCTAFAIEPSLEAQKYLKSNDIKILVDDVSENWHNDYSHKFDIIIMRHVLEHFIDPQEILHKVRSVLSENGLLYLAVPNCLAPQKPLQTHWFRVVHTYYFNKYSIQNITTLSNLKTLNIVEGDVYSRGELYSFLKKEKKEIEPDFKEEHYIKQRRIFLEKIRKENKLLYIASKKVKSFINLILKFFKTA